MPTIKPPTSDWSCREILDARAVDPMGTPKCEFCGHRIRWIHVLEHDDYPRNLEAGCCCAARYCFDYDAEGAEREAKNRAGRMRRFVDQRRWKPSQSNPENICRFVRLGDGQRTRLTIYMKEGRYGIYLEGSNHWNRYDTQAEAKVMAFELVERVGELTVNQVNRNPG